MKNFERMNIVVWRGVIVDYNTALRLMDEGETVKPANASELKRYYERP